jgi:hypothetical protein
LPWTLFWQGGHKEQSFLFWRSCLKDPSSWHVSDSPLIIAAKELSNCWQCSLHVTLIFYVWCNN